MNSELTLTRETHSQRRVIWSGSCCNRLTRGVSPGKYATVVTRTYDLVMTHKLDTDDLFIHEIQKNAVAARLNFFLIEPVWVDCFYDALEKGRVWSRGLINMHSEHHQPDEIFHRLVRLASEKNVKVIDPLDRALEAFDKARLHPRLVAAGINVPYTVLVPRAEAETFSLSDEQRSALGAPFVIKPAMGYGRKGAVLDAVAEQDIARSITAFQNDNYLLQKHIVPRQINGAPAYFRVFFVFGSVWCVWWNCFTDQYRVVTPQEAIDLELKPLEETIRQIAQLTGMSFFSSEIAQTESGEFVVIDYVNDQCHMLSQSANPQMGVPDEIVAAIARRLVEAARGLIGR